MKRRIELHPKPIFSPKPTEITTPDGRVSPNFTSEPGSGPAVPTAVYR